MGGGLTNLWAILLKQETYRRPLKLSSFLLSFCYSAVMDVFLLSCNYLFSLCECGIWPKVSLQLCFSLFQFWIFGERKSTWPERLKYNDYRFMYRQTAFSCNHLQTTVDVMFPTETSLNDFSFFFSFFFRFGGIKEVIVSYAFRDHLLNRLMLDCVSSICEVYFVDGTPGIYI